MWGAFAVTRQQSGAERVLVANDVASEAGVRPGQSLTNAVAVCPDLLSEPQDDARDRRLLMALHAWSDRFSPRVAPEAPDSLVMDVTGCAHLFGGEADMVERMYTGLAALKVTAHIAVANTKLAARGFARHMAEPTYLTDPEREHRAVGALPVAALTLDAKTSATLRRLGVCTVGELSGFKASELSRRFSTRVPEALERLCGHRADPLVPSARAHVFSASRKVAEPISHLEAISNILFLLAERVCRDLAHAGHAARGFRFTVQSMDSGAHTLDVGFSAPVRETEPIVRQFERPLESLRLEFGADGFRLLALGVEVFAHSQVELTDDRSQTELSYQQTLTTLGNRLGFDRLRRPEAGLDHAPELEHGSAPVVDTTPRPKPDAYTYSPRPEMVWPAERVRVETPGLPPLLFAWRGKMHSLVRARGPERVSPAWWHAGSFPRTRDFWRAVTSEGRVLWLMVVAGAPEEGWFCCGEFLIEPRLALPAA